MGAGGGGRQGSPRPGLGLRWRRGANQGFRLRSGSGDLAAIFSSNATGVHSGCTAPPCSEQRPVAPRWCGCWETRQPPYNCCTSAYVQHIHTHKTSYTSLARSTLVVWFWQTCYSSGAVRTLRFQSASQVCWASSRNSVSSPRRRAWRP
jgi:hypothetical protein